MTGYPRRSLAQKVIQIREHFRRSIQKGAISKERNAGRKFLKEVLASYRQKKKFETM